MVAYRHGRIGAPIGIVKEHGGCGRTDQGLCLGFLPLVVLPFVFTGFAIIALLRVWCGRHQLFELFAGSASGQPVRYVALGGRPGRLTIRTDTALPRRLRATFAACCWPGSSLSGRMTTCAPR